MTQSPSFRQASTADATELLQLARDCVAAMRSAGIEQWDEVYPSLDNIQTDIAHGTLWVWQEDEKIMGCITVDSHQDPMWKNLAWTPNSEPVAAVHRLMVHPSQQGRGLATQLMHRAEAIARQSGSRSVRLDTFTNNPAAMALYPRMGYMPTGTVILRKGEFMGYEKLLND